MSIAEQTGTEPDELDGPEIPEIVWHVWQWYQELSSSRSGGPITYQEIDAWARLTGRTPSSMEIELIKELDFQHLKATRDGR